MRSLRDRGGHGRDKHTRRMPRLRNEQQQHGPKRHCLHHGTNESTIPPIIKVAAVWYMTWLWMLWFRTRTPSGGPSLSLHESEQVSAARGLVYRNAKSSHRVACMAKSILGCQWDSSSSFLPQSISPTENPFLLLCHHNHTSSSSSFDRSTDIHARRASIRTTEGLWGADPIAPPFQIHFTPPLSRHLVVCPTRVVISE